MPAYVDREYQSLNSLQVRIRTHRLYGETADDFEQTVIEEAGLAAAGSVLDVGSGTGSLLRRLRHDSPAARLCALDSSPAAVAACADIPGAGAVLGDAQNLPFGAGEFAAVTARHMLYHLDKPVRAIREARRVLEPGGRFAATVNHESVTPLMMSVLHDVLASHGVSPPPSPDSRVHAGNLPGMIADVFGPATVRVRSVEGALVFPAPEPVIDYLLTTLTLSGVPEDSPRHGAVARDIESAIRARFDQLEGPWRDPKGYVVCTATAGGSR